MIIGAWIAAIHDNIKFIKINGYGSNGFCSRTKLFIIIHEISTIKKNSETKQKDEEKEINNQDIYDYKKKISELESQVDELERNNRELSDKIDDYKRKISALNE